VKERLTGAIILVALIVLLVPELLTGPVRSGTSPQAAATSSEEPPLRSYTINLADDARARSTTSSVETTAPVPSGSPQPAPTGPPAITEGTPPAASMDSGAQTSSSGPAAADGSAASSPASGSAQTHTPTPPVTKPTPEPVATGDGTRWMVQLGVFASRDNAERLAQELKGKGFKISVSELPGNGRKLFRVRAGPVSDRTSASDLAAKLRAAGAPGSVVPRS
jgi:cell division septation protein DedD